MTIKKLLSATAVAGLMLGASAGFAGADQGARGEGKCWGSVVSWARSSGSSAHAGAGLGYPGGWRALEGAHGATPCQLLEVVSSN